MLNNKSYSNHKTPYSIELLEENINVEWHKEIVSQQKVGGVMLVFIAGKTQKELKDKSREIKEFCKKLKNKYKD